MKTEAKYLKWKQKQKVVEPGNCLKVSFITQIWWVLNNNISSISGTLEPLGEFVDNTDIQPYPVSTKISLWR